MNVKGKNYCSPIGLSYHGKWFLELLMEENMIIDVDHMSRLAFHGALKIAEKKNYFRWFHRILVLEECSKGVLGLRR